MFKQSIFNTFVFGVFTVILLTLTQCSQKAASDLPKDILGIGIGMNKENTEQRLREIGKFMRNDGKRDQVWLLNDNPNFGYLAIGFDKNNRVNYVTAIAKPRDGQPVFFKNVGDLNKAKLEVAGPNHRYTWDVAADGSNAGYQVIAQGASTESLSLFTLHRPNNPEDKDEENKE